MTDSAFSVSKEFTDDIFIIVIVFTPKTVVEVSVTPTEILKETVEEDTSNVQ